MATGNPRPRYRAVVEDSASTELPGSGSTAIHLTYHGKKKEAAILQTTPARVDLIWSSPSSGESLCDNRLYFGENLSVLATLLYDSKVRGKVRLIYIDPPYATRSVFHSRSQEEAYDDLLSGAPYVEFIRERLVLLRELLADDGSIYVHLDKNMAFAIKIVMDEVFGASNFRNWITRKKCNPKNYTSKTYGNVADYLLFYTKGDAYIWHRPVELWTDERSGKEYQYVDAQGRRYKKVPIHAPGVRNGETGKPWRGMQPPPGKHWQYPPATLDEMDASGDIYWSPTGNPRRKVYLDQSDGVAVQDIWMEFRDAHNQQIHVTGYPTEKNPDLLARLIEASSNPGDLVLDCFSGSGTTLAVAERLKRRWIGADNSAKAIAATLSRFALGTKPMGDFVALRKQHAETSPDHAHQLSFVLDKLEEADAQPQADWAVDNFTLFAERSLSSHMSMHMPHGQMPVTELAERFSKCCSGE